METILRLTAFDLLARESVTGGLPLPGGEIDYERPLSFSWPGRQTVDYISSTHGRTTAPDDTPANTAIRPGFSGQFNYAISLFGGIDPTSGASSQAGALNIVDTGDLDGLLDKALDGATLELLRGDIDAAVSAFSTVAKFTTGGMIYTPTEKRLLLRDLSWRLTAAPLHDIRFQGTGGYEGDEGLANIIRPIVYGVVENITPVLVNKDKRIYQVSCTPVQAIPAVREGGLALDPGTDYADYDALEAASDGLPDGTYATCLAKGLFAVANPPEKDITADVEGDNESIGGVGYVSTRAAIARRIAIGRGALKFTTAGLDEASFTALDAAQAGTCGWYFNEEITKAAALNEVMQGCLGLWWVSLTGLLTVDYLREPPAAADIVIVMPGGDDVGDADIIGDPEMNVEDTAPRQTTYLGYARNYTVQEQNALYLAADPQAYAQETKKVTATSGRYRRVWPTTPVVTTASGFAVEDRTKTEADRIQALLGKPRQRFTVPTSLDAYTPVIMQAVEIRGWTRFGMRGSKVFWCVGVSVTDKNRLTLDLWG